MEKKLLFLSLFVWLLSACGKDEQPNPEPEEIKQTGIYILNAGKMGNNDATLDYYDSETKVFKGDIFTSSNRRGLGDTGQSILVYGSKIYIAVSGSSTIEITDLSGLSLNHLDVKDNNGAPRMPRYFAHYQNKVYVTLFDGYVACIDTAQMVIEKQVKVGDNPEQLVTANKKLYVANSGGLNFPTYGKTVSVIDVSSFTVSKTLEVGENPQYVVTDSLGNNVYLISTGDYSPGSNILQRIDTKTDVVTKIEGLNASWLSMGAGDKLYVISTEYDDNWNMTAKYYVYDAQNQKLLGNFITDGTTIPNPYHISADKANGQIYIGSSDYISRGDMYIFSAEGKFLHKFGVSGINPEGAYFKQ
jgi:hypothetical protein